MNSTQLAPTAATLYEITRNDGHWAIQGHSRSPILIPIESPVRLLVNNTNLCPISHRFRVIAVYWSNIASDRGASIYLPRSHRELWTVKFGLLKLETSLYRVIISIY